MKYWTRIQLAAAAASLLVTLFLAAFPHLFRDHEVLAKTPDQPRAVRLNFQQPEPFVPEPDPVEPVRRLIDPGAEAPEEPRDTDLISSRDSRAQDMSEQEGEENRPAVDIEDDFDELGTPPVPPPSPAATPSTAQQEEAAESQPVEEAAAEPSEVAESEQANEAEAAPEQPASDVRVADVRLPESELESDQESGDAEDSDVPDEPVEGQAEETPEKEEVERFQVAEAQPATPSPEAQPSPPLPTQELRSTRGRPGGGSISSGFTSFEANKHELGEYMLHIRNRVEREWRSALQLRYSGISRTYAVIRCSIRPDGSLEYVRIVDPGDSMTYAVLCRQAIENAAPFEPFPFDVPQIYREENLEITWKFSYL